MIKIAPSILSADFSNLGRDIGRVEKAGADLIHIDVMDGHFVPNITIGPLVVSACRKITRLPLDVHLMIESPDKYFAPFCAAGADLITFHVEASKDIERDIAKIKERGAAAGLVVNPATPIEPVFKYLDRISLVLVMSVNPGFEKQAFMPEVLPKIERLRKEISRRALPVDIEVDGGVNPENSKAVIAAGANILVAGSAIFYSQDLEGTIRKLRSV